MESYNKLSRRENDVLRAGRSVFFFVFVFLTFPPSGSGVRVFSFQTDEWAPPSEQVFLRMQLGEDGRFGGASVQGFTLCYRFRNAGFAREEVHVSYALPGAPNALLVYREATTLRVVLNNTKMTGLGDYRPSLALGVWTHFCLAVDAGAFTFYASGEERATGRHSFPVPELRFDGFLVLGQEQDAYGAGFVLGEMFLGDLAQVNLWSRVLAAHEVRELAGCATELHGDIFSLDVDVMENSGVAQWAAPLRELCAVEEKVVVYTQPLSFRQSMTFCEVFGGELHTPATCADNEALFERLSGFSAECPDSFWVGVSDERREGTWEGAAGQALPPDCFNFPPNGERAENCAAFRMETGLWDDKSCTHPLRCFSCRSRRPFLLRGLCFNTPEQMLFEARGYRNQQPYFRGFYGLVLFAGNGSEWTLLDVATNQSLAELRITEGHSYPVGRRRWTLAARMCKFSANDSVLLSLSTCGLGQVVCADGSCVPGSARCDGKYQCRDLSDESDCEVIRVPAGYRRQLSPGPPEGGVPHHLNISLSFLRFLSIEDAKFSVTTEFNLRTQWRDRRLTYRNLLADGRGSKVGREVQQKVWWPEVKFTNILDGNVKELDAEITVVRTNASLERDFNDVEMDTTYSGDAAILVQTRHISGVFECAFDVYNYPFDTQKCLVQFVVSKDSGETITVPRDGTQVRYFGPTDLPSFQVGGFGVESSDSERGRVVQVYFSLERRPRLLVIKLFIPSFMLLVIGYVTLYIPRNLLQARLVVSLTTLLVLYTLFSQASSSLPNTAYIKLIDIWFFFCICTLFFIILFHVFSEYLPERRTNVVRAAETDMYTDKRLPTYWFTGETATALVRTFLIPGGTVIFLGVYWYELTRS